MLTLMLETLDECKAEIYGICESQQYAELAQFTDHVPMCVDWKRYYAMEYHGELFIVVARSKAKIVGYYFCDISLHRRYASTLMAHLDFFYVVPEYRGRGLVFRLFDAVEKELRRRKAKAWYTGYKTDNPLGLDLILPKMGFSPSNTTLVKWLGDD